MWRGMLALLMGGGLCFGLTVWAASQSTFTYKHPQRPDVRIVVSGEGAKVDLSAAAAKISSETGATSLPKARPQTTEFHFGFMDPLATARHEFVVANDGDAPLTLETASTTCKCTVAGVKDNVVPPGSAGTVALEWTTPAKGRIFQQSAVIRTNDPLRKQLEFTVRGNVRVLVAADTEAVHVPDMTPDEPRSTTVLVYSQTWHGFEIADLKATTPGLTWTQAPAVPLAAPELDATSVAQLTITLPGDLPQGEINDTLTLTLRPMTLGDESSEPITLELPLHARMRRRLAVYGSAINSLGILTVGPVNQGMPKQVKVFLKIRDAEPTLPELVVETTPSFLQVQITPHQEPGSDTPVAGLYEMVVTVPADAPPCNYLGDRMGQVRIVTGHPRIPETPLGVRFGVIQQP